MRTDDIIMPKGSGISNYSAGLYMPSRRKAEEMTAAQLRRGLCAKSAGNWHACEVCQGGCSIGDRLVAIMRGVVDEPTPEPVVCLPEAQITARRIAMPVAYNSTAHRAAVQKAARALILVDGGMSRVAAARTVGYTRWENIAKVIQRSPGEVEIEKRRLRDEPTATP